MFLTDHSRRHDQRAANHNKNVAVAVATFLRPTFMARIRDPLKRRYHFTAAVTDSGKHYLQQRRRNSEP
jgi:hypothetical protein